MEKLSKKDKCEICHSLKYNIKTIIYIIRISQNKKEELFSLLWGNKPKKKKKNVASAEC